MNLAIANPAIAFVLAFASTLFVGATQQGGSPPIRPAAIAAFGAALGYALGRFSYSGAATVEHDAKWVVAVRLVPVGGPVEQRWALPVIAPCLRTQQSSHRGCG